MAFININQSPSLAPHESYNPPPLIVSECNHLHLSELSLHIVIIFYLPLLYSAAFLIKSFPNYIFISNLLTIFTNWNIVHLYQSNDRFFPQSH